MDYNGLWGVTTPIDSRLRCANRSACFLRKRDARMCVCVYACAYACVCVCLCMCVRAKEYDGLQWALRRDHVHRLPVAMREQACLLP